MIKCPNCGKSAATFFAWLPGALTLHLRCRVCDASLKAGLFTQYILFGVITVSIGIAASVVVVLRQLGIELDWTRGYFLKVSVIAAIGTIVLTSIGSFIGAWLYGVYDLEKEQSSKPDAEHHPD